MPLIQQEKQEQHSVRFISKEPCVKDPNLYWWTQPPLEPNIVKSAPTTMNRDPLIRDPKKCNSLSFSRFAVIQGV